MVQPLLSAAAFAENDGILRTFTSPDGLTFTQVSQSYSDAAPLRDPSIIYFYGKYWAAYTIDGGINAFGLANSNDGITWAFVANIPTHATGALMWSPSWFIDPADGSVHLIINFEVTVGQIFRPYEMHPVTTDMLSWSNAAPISGAWNALTNMIDGFMHYDAGTYYLWYKNDTANFVELASSTSLLSGFTLIKTGDWAGWGSGNITGSNHGYEAPSAITLANGTHRVYIDSSVAHGLYYSDSVDYVNWSALQLTTWNGTGGLTMSGPDVRLLTPPV